MASAHRLLRCWCLLLVAASTLKAANGDYVLPNAQSGGESWPTSGQFLPAVEATIPPRRHLLQNSCPGVPGVGTGPSPAQTVTPAMRTCFVQVIQNEWQNAQNKTPNLAAGLARIMFHDAAGGKMDASLLLNRKETEFGPNSNTRGFEAIQLFKNKIASSCNGAIISWADALVLATAAGIKRRGGPDMTQVIPLGRGDSTAIGTTLQNIPSPFQDAAGLVETFRAIFGPTFSTADIVRLTVTLSGAHTLGGVDCILVRDTTGANPQFAASVAQKCGVQTGGCPRFPLDPTNQKFDNRYYSNLIAKAGVLSSDDALFSAGVCLDGVCTKDLVQLYAANQPLFHNNFKWAFCRLSVLGTRLTCPPSIFFFKAA